MVFFLVSLRRMCRVSLADCIRNKVIHRMSGSGEKITLSMKKSAFSLIGHDRISDERMVNKLFFNKKQTDIKQTKRIK